MVPWQIKNTVTTCLLSHSICTDSGISHLSHGTSLKQPFMPNVANFTGSEGNVPAHKWIWAVVEVHLKRIKKKKMKVTALLKNKWWHKQMSFVFAWFIYLFIFIHCQVLATDCIPEDKSESHKSGLEAEVTRNQALRPAEWTHPLRSNLSVIYPKRNVTGVEGEAIFSAPTRQLSVTGGPPSARSHFPVVAF